MLRQSVRGSHCSSMDEVVTSLTWRPLGASLGAGGRWGTGGKVEEEDERER